MKAACSGSSRPLCAALFGDNGRPPVCALACSVISLCNPVLLKSLWSTGTVISFSSLIMSSVMLGFNFLLCGCCVFKGSAVVKIDIKNVMDVLFSQHSLSSAKPTQCETLKKCAFMHDYILFQLPSSMNLVCACARPFMWGWTFSPAGGSTPLSLLV